MAPNEFLWAAHGRPVQHNRPIGNQSNGPVQDGARAFFVALLFQPERPIAQRQRLSIRPKTEGPSAEQDRRSCRRQQHQRRRERLKQQRAVIATGRARLLAKADLAAPGKRLTFLDRFDLTLTTTTKEQYTPPASTASGSAFIFAAPKKSTSRGCGASSCFFEQPVLGERTKAPSCTSCPNTAATNRRKFLQAWRSLKGWQLLSPLPSRKWVF